MSILRSLTASCKLLFFYDRMVYYDFSPHTIAGLALLIKGMAIVKRLLAKI